MSQNDPLQIDLREALYNDRRALILCRTKQEALASSQTNRTKLQLTEGCQPPVGNLGNLREEAP